MKTRKTNRKRAAPFEVEIDWKDVQAFGVKISHRFQPNGAAPRSLRVLSPPRLKILTVAQ